MTVAKLTASGKAMLVVDDSGNVFIAPLSALFSLFERRVPIVSFNRLPYALPAERFGQSDLWDSDGTKKKYSELEEGQVPIDSSVQRKKEEYKIYDDVVIE